MPGISAHTFTSHLHRKSRFWWCLIVILQNEETVCIAVLQKEGTDAKQLVHSHSRKIQTQVVWYQSPCSSLCLTYCFTLNMKLSLTIRAEETSLMRYFSGTAPWRVRIQSFPIWKRWEPVRNFLFKYLVDS